MSRRKGPPKARINVSVPAGTKARMDAYGGEVNWSEVATAAFEDFLLGAGEQAPADPPGPGSPEWADAKLDRVLGALARLRAALKEET